MKKQITEEQIKQISTGEKDIREVFPEVFETKLDKFKEGDYWFHNNGDLILIFEATECHGGIIKCKNISNTENFSFHHINVLYKKATPEEVEKALIKEAKRRGYNVGATIKWDNFEGVIDGNLYWAKGSDCLSVSVNPNSTKRQNNNFPVMFKGKWAEIISKPIKKYEDLKEISGYYVGECCDIQEISVKNGNEDNFNICKTYDQAKALIALSQLSQLIPEYNGDWVADFNTAMQNKYCIFFYKNKITIGKTICYNYFLAFKTKEIAEEFLNNNRELILKAKPFLG